MIACLYLRDADGTVVSINLQVPGATCFVTALMLAGAAKTAFLQGKPVQMVPLHLAPGLA